ncbi:MAG: 3-isopropylmalate/(R)-2-methylmalate dehydratase large subunit [Actinomycetota bacterium]|jgi:3-isopropylmalate/(R)-2-methylmalate dehydratase large subunit|nr:3-isopropylmalate/(R)-2-methylmalate dehydratase large subunit [Actinomycetota bacterium]
MSASTLFDKIWDAHVVRDLDDGWSLLHIDRHLLHDLSGPPAMVELHKRGLEVHDPDLVFATPDHLVSSAAGRTIDSNEFGGAMWSTLTDEAERSGIRTFELGSVGQGIVHVTGPEQGIVLPGLTVICGDSHTCTNGALGALAFGVGTSQSTQALATQVLAQVRPRQMRISIEGTLAPYVTAKDIALALIGRFGASAGAGFAVEYAGPVIEAMEMDARLTLCNLTVELGAKFGLIAPDATTVAWIRGRRYAPADTEWQDAVEAWAKLVTDPDAVFDRDEVVDATTIGPFVTWGTSPEHAIAIDDVVPDPADVADVAKQQSWQAALDYMELRAGQPIAGTPVDWVFIGSCANSRLSDLRAAARVAAGRTVASGVTAWVVPGSEMVRRDAEAEGLDSVFRAAGFEWRLPGCSMCVAANGERVPPGARCVSTSNRNFVGRQGPGARTHLASPATAAAAAIAGRLVDVRSA